jgi:hypothetical protein
VSEPDPYPNEEFRQAVERAAKVKIGTKVVQLGIPGQFTYDVLDLELPAGKGTRTLRVDSGTLGGLLAMQFEKFRFSQQFDALVDTESGDIECSLTEAPALFNISGQGLWDLPGVQIDGDSPLRTGEGISEYGTPEGWRLVVADADVQLELSPIGSAFRGFYGAYPHMPSVTLKVRHRAGKKGPRVDELLGGPAADFLLDLDLKYGTRFTLARPYKSPDFHTPWKVGTTPPSFPRQHYSEEAVAFYWYAESASQFPLLQFLAYYQVLEYFFSSFTRRSALEQLRTQLKDPAFDPRNDRDLAVLLDSTRTAHAGLRRESEQLRETLTESVTSDALSLFIENVAELKSQLTASKQSIKGVRPIQLSGTEVELNSQISDRIYAIRNRIVHSKDAAGDNGLELLLPTSEEAAFMGPEITLVRWFAQRALIHGAQMR